MSLFIAGLGLCFVLLLTRRWSSKGKSLFGLILICYFIFGMMPVGLWAVNLLEDRFVTVRDYDAPVAGILVLAGSVSTVMTRERKQVSVGGNIERLTEFVRLARQHPEAKLVFVGGQGRVFDRKLTEAEVAKQFMQEIGMDTERVWFEDGSRNTEEGARLSFEILKPGATPWILITSARHMPRSVGLFRKAGWNILAHPVDYLTLPNQNISWVPQWPGGLGGMKEALYEWGGLFFAWIRGKIDEPFPGPKPVAQVIN